MFSHRPTSSACARFEDLPSTASRSEARWHAGKHRRQCLCPTTKGSPLLHPPRECRATYSRSTLSIRDCQPSPVDLKNATTSGLYLTDSSSFLFSDFGLPRSDRIGTMAASCASVNGWASGSAFAAAMIAASSWRVGITMVGRLAVFDLMFHLATFGSTRAPLTGQAPLLSSHHPVATLPIDSYCRRRRAHCWIQQRDDQGTQTRIPIARLEQAASDYLSGGQAIGEEGLERRAIAGQCASVQRQEPSASLPRARREEAAVSLPT